MKNMKNKLILDNSFTDFELTKMNPAFEEVINSKYTSVNIDFINPENIIKAIQESPENFESNFPNNRYMDAYLKDAVKYFEKLEEYEKCSIIQKYLSDYFAEIPETKEKIINQLIETVNRILLTSYSEESKYEKKNTEVVALNLYEKIGRVYIYGLALWKEDLPLTQEFIKSGVYHPQLMIFNMLKETYDKIFENA